jgi:iron complex outermembrane receptor protein
LACLLAALPPGLCFGADSDDTPLQEIVVTATRRDTKLLETPISMTVIGGETLRAANVDDFSDFEGLVPGLTAIDSGPGEKRYALRGLQSAGEPEVALYYDDIPIAGLPGGSLDTGDDQPDLKLWDVDRIEVLRGPQGTLYGNGAMGGAIRVLSNQPNFSAFSASAQAQGGTIEGGGPSWGGSAMVNIPFTIATMAAGSTI